MMAAKNSTIQERIEMIRERIHKAAARAGRKDDEIRFMVVSKTRTGEEIMEAYNTGVRLFGENRVKEGITKFQSLPDDVELHMIGHLQRNKAKDGAAHFQMVQSIDKFSTALALEKYLEEAGKVLPVLLEYNTSKEASKHGYLSDDALFQDIEQIAALPHIKIQGLMTMAPFTKEEAPIRKSFRLLSSLQNKLASKFNKIDFSVLSMGMTNDYEIAVEEGSTLLRIGTAVFEDMR